MYDRNNGEFQDDYKQFVILKRKAITTISNNWIDAKKHSYKGWWEEGRSANQQKLFEAVAKWEK